MRSCPGLLKGYGGKIDTNELRTGCARNPLAGPSATTSEIGDFRARPDLERIGQLAQFSSGYVSVCGCLRRIFVAERLQ
jgi:hypothetical protein